MERIDPSPLDNRVASKDKLPSHVMLPRVHAEIPLPLMHSNGPLPRR
ncbi:hypothetical protein A2U01_0073698, partial [Trifolium medium]|nr:hypothetical protein [Trifolium medium]